VYFVGLYYIIISQFTMQKTNKKNCCMSRHFI